MNTLYLTFSEPLKLQSLGSAANYQVSGGVNVTSATVLSPRSVQLRTSAQTPGAAYSVTINNLEDLAGNKLAANTVRAFNAFNIVTNAVGVELWRTITGSSINDLRNNERYPAQPDEDYSIGSLDSFLLPVLTNSDNNTYGGRMRAWLTPEETGEYEFFIRADDQGELRLSTDDQFTLLDDPDFILNEFPTAADLSSGDTFQEPGFDDSVSFPIQLEQGKRYALQVLWKESNGSDYVQIAWRKVGDPTPAAELPPIPGRFLSYYGPVASTPGPEATISRIAVDAGRVVIDWTGSTLESSVNLSDWTAEAGAAQPYSVTPQGHRFYRARR
jgi:hypothetical protein